jgi:hypothetical protein
VSIAPPIISFIAIFSLAWITGRVLRRRREQVFNVYRKKSRQYVSERYPLTPLEASASLDRLNALSDLAAQTHQQAIDAQSNYYSTLEHVPVEITHNLRA